ncbi:MAG TPA: hypothetical protein VGG75_41290 [Trebonia sp.]|jgi:hypothetical protein
MSESASSSGSSAGGGQAEFRVMLRPIATSLPLGFFAFTAGTILLTALELRWVPFFEDPQLMLMVLAFVVPLEVISGLMAFAARDSGAATGLTLLGAAWLATSLTVMHGAPGALSLPLAIFLLVLTPLMAAMAIPAMSGTPLFGVVLSAGALRFALTGIFQATGIQVLEQIAGWIGVPLAAFALYGGLALLLEEASGRLSLPLGRRGRSRTSLTGGFEHQIQQAEQEPGIRRQL